MIDVFGGFFFVFSDLKLTFSWEVFLLLTKIKGIKRMRSRLGFCKGSICCLKECSSLSPPMPPR